MLASRQQRRTEHEHAPALRLGDRHHARVSWDAVADLYYMALAAHKCGAQHHVLDLVPNQTYHVTLPPG